MEVLIGCDPELFVMDLSPSNQGNFQSAHTIFPGTKALPAEVPCGAIQVDGVAFEFNINPAANVGQFINNISTVLTIGRSILQDQAPGRVLIPTPTATFDRKYFDSLPEETKLLGCEPDFNAYTGKENPRPETSEPFRTGSGHVHIGWGDAFDRTDPGHFLDCRRMVMQMDAALYPASLLWDNDDKRRSLYGNVGAFRPKSYGVEYRVLSNSWLKNPELQKYIFESTKKAAELLLEQGIFLPKDKDIKQVMDHSLKGSSFSKGALIDYVGMLEASWDFPAFPFEVVKVG